MQEPHESLEDKFSNLCQGVEECGYRLSRLWKQSAHAKLLQRPPLAAHNAKHADLIKQTTNYVTVLRQILQAVRGLQDQGFLIDGPVFFEAAFAGRPVAMLSKLLVWLQQQPELLQLHLQLLLSPDPGACGAVHGLGPLWLNCCSALGELLLCVGLWCKDTTSSSSSSSCCRVFMQAGEELIQAGLPQQLPGFLWHVVEAAAPAGHIAQSSPLQATVKLASTAVCVLTDRKFTNSLSWDWSWAGAMLQQLLNCAVAAGLMQALPGGGVANAAIAYSKTQNSSSCSSSSSSSATNDSTAEDSAKTVCVGINAVTEGLFRRSAYLPSNNSRLVRESAAQMANLAVAEMALQRLASSCLILQRRHVQQQQQQQQRLLSLQLGRRMRGDLLLLPDPKQRLAELLPAEIYLVADAAADADLASNNTEAHRAAWFADELRTFLSTLHLFITFHGLRGRGSGSTLGLSAAALQLTAELLLRAAAAWQQALHCLTDKQQTLLTADAASLDTDDTAEAGALRQQLAHVSNMMVQGCKLLGGQFLQLTSRGQWQPQMQLLQQGGGQVLLQGLTLAVNSGSMHAKLPPEESCLQAAEVLSVLVGRAACPTAGQGANANQQSPSSQQELFVSMLARKHPVPFFQFLDLCIRTCQLKADPTLLVAQLAVNGSGRIGSKGLSELLSSPAATAALVSALCSIIKLSVLYISLDPDEAAEVAVRCGPVPGCLIWLTNLQKLLQRLSRALQPALHDAAAEVAADPTAGIAVEPAVPASSTSSSSSNFAQVRASAVFVTTLLCRSLMALDAAAAAAAMLPGDAADERSKQLIGLNFELQYKQRALQVFWEAFATLQLCLQGKCAAAADSSSATAAAAADALQEQASSSSSSNSSQRVRWQYLLRLHESRKLAAATAALSSIWDAVSIAGVLPAEWKRAGVVPASNSDGSRCYAASRDMTEQIPRMREMYQDALGFCATLVAVAPLPVVCNNPGCVELGGVSEAATARYVCAGCGCRYCSAACQAAGWRSHKKACRRMAACGMRVEV